MVKRFIVFILVLCCAFSFICQPVSAAATTTILTVAEIGMAIAGLYGIALASDAAYGALGTLLHDSVVAVPGSAGTEWWNGCQSGRIRFQNIEAGVQKAVNAVLAEAADSIPQTEQDCYDYVFSPTCYILTDEGKVLIDYRDRSYTFKSDVGVSPVMFQYYIHNGDMFTYGISVMSPSPFYFGSTLVNKDESTGLYVHKCVTSGYSKKNQYDQPSQYKGFDFFSSPADFNAYRDSCMSLISGTSSVGGATAAYPTYGYDGVSLPDMDLTQAGLIGADGTSTVSDLIAQLQSGAITWEDYIGTVAPGQTATITLTDAEGGAITYKLTNTGVGERIDTGSGSETDETQPIPVVPPGTGTETDIGSKIDGLGASMAEHLTSIKTGLQDFFTSVTDYFSSVLEKLQSIYDSVVEWLTAIRDAIVQFATDVVTWFTTVVETITTTGAQIVDAIKRKFDPRIKNMVAFSGSQNL